jgi:8-oxo-dGTP pyrophosphatase MutT (NUDIX family)
LDYTDIIDGLRQQLQQPLPGREAQERMTGRVLPMPNEIPPNARKSAVLMLLYPIENIPHILLIKRVDDGKAHSGQIGFPGGRMDKTDADLQATALREAYEEVGILPSVVDVLGQLTPLYIPVSNFHVFPFIGHVQARPEYILNTTEIAATLEIPVHRFLLPELKTTVDVTSPVMPEKIRNVRAYKLLDGTIIWGATAMIISELEMLLAEYFV